MSMLQLGEGAGRAADTTAGVAVQGRESWHGIFSLVMSFRLVLSNPTQPYITRQQFNVSVLVRHKPIPKPVLEPSAYADCPVETGGSSNAAIAAVNHTQRILSRLFSSKYII